MRNKYQFNFTSHNSGQQFTLSFTVAGGRVFHLVQDLQVYQHHGDLFATILQRTDNSPWRYHVETMFSDHKFDIEIHIDAEGCETFITESVITTIDHQKQLQPCN